MYKIKMFHPTVHTEIVRRRDLEALRMLSDLELRRRGYVPSSVTSACLQAEEDDRVTEQICRDVGNS